MRGNRWASNRMSNRVETCSTTDICAWTQIQDLSIEKRDFIKVRVMPAGAMGILGSPINTPPPKKLISGLSLVSLDDSVSLHWKNEPTTTHNKSDSLFLIHPNEIKVKPITDTQGRYVHSVHAGDVTPHSPARGLESRGRQEASKHPQTCSLH